MDLEQLLLDQMGWVKHRVNHLVVTVAIALNLELELLILTTVMAQIP
jgi:hypothetical protein